MRLKYPTRLQKLYLKFIKQNEKTQYLVLLLENPIAYNQFFNLNFNIHHLVLKFYRTYRLDKLKEKRFKELFNAEGWIVLDKEISSGDVHYDTVKCNYRIVHENIRKLKYELNKNIQIFNSKKQKMDVIDLQKQFVEKLLEFQTDLFSRTSLKQVNRTFNQEKKIAEISIIANPITILSIKDCFFVFAKNLNKYSCGIHQSIVSDVKINSTGTISEPAINYINTLLNNSETQTRLEPPIEELDLSLDWLDVLY